MNRDEISELQRLEFKEAFQEFDKVRLENTKIFGISKINEQTKNDSSMIHSARLTVTRVNVHCLFAKKF